MLLASVPESSARGSERKPGNLRAYQASGHHREAATEADKITTVPVCFGGITPATKGEKQTPEAWLNLRRQTHLWCAVGLAIPCPGARLQSRTPLRQACSLSVF